MINKKFVPEKNSRQLPSTIDYCANKKYNDLIDWLSNFYEFEFKKGRPYTIIVTEIIGDY